MTPPQSSGVSSGNISYSPQSGGELTPIEIRGLEKSIHEGEQNKILNPQKNHTQ